MPGSFVPQNTQHSTRQYVISNLLQTFGKSCLLKHLSKVKFQTQCTVFAGKLPFCSGLSPGVFSKPLGFSNECSYYATKALSSKLAILIFLWEFLYSFNGHIYFVMFLLHYHCLYSNRANARYFDTLKTLLLSQANKAVVFVTGIRKTIHSAFHFHTSKTNMLGCII